MRSSERMSGKIIPRASLRQDAPCHGTKQQNRLITPDYCRDCRHRECGNTWDKDYCWKLKKLCKDSRKKGQFVVLKCPGFGDLIKFQEINLDKS
jgi:hypothetical protein